LAENLKPVELNGSPVQPNLNYPLLLQAGSLAVFFFLLFAPTLPPLFRDWFEFGTFSHGLLVPFISAYLAWQRKDLLRAMPVRSSYGGLLLIVPALLMALIGKAIGDAFLERVAMVLCFGGMVWLLLGWQIVKTLSFPLAYLLLMIPFPYVVVKEVAFQLRILNAAAAAPILRLLGIPVYRDSYFLHLPDVTLEVADLCSGISSVFALFALGGAYVFFTPMRPALKFVAVLSTLPFAVLINLFRIVLTAALSYYISLAVLGVLIHELTGTITFFIALTLFILLCEFLQRCFLSRGEMRPGAVSVENEGNAGNSLAGVSVEKASWRPSAFAMAVLILALYFSWNVSGQREMPLSTDLASVVPRLAGFELAATNKDGFYKDSSAEFDVSRTYSSSSGESIEMYVGFRGKQQGDKRLHSPKLQFPYGWNFLWIEPALVVTAEAPVNARWMMTQNNQVKVLVLYWYQVGDQTFAGEIEKRLKLVLQTLFHGRSDGAVVRLATRVSDAEKIEQAKERLGKLAAELAPQMFRVLPK
jgi:EpsI family protein